VRHAGQRQHQPDLAQPRSGPSVLPLLTGTDSYARKGDHQLLRPTDTTRPTRNDHPGAAMCPAHARTQQRSGTTAHPAPAQWLTNHRNSGSPHSGTLALAERDIQTTRPHQMKPNPRKRQ
jgi:hypothetical protein